MNELERLKRELQLKDSIIELREQEIELLTQKDAYSWDDHDIDEVIYNRDEIVIVGTDK